MLAQTRQLTREAQSKQALRTHDAEHMGGRLSRRSVSGRSQ